jgi:hypothetical protein
VTAPTTVGGTRVRRLDRWEWPAVLVLGAVSMLVVAFMSTSLWHLSDAWDFLTGRSFVEPATWFEPHAGHWQTTTVLAYQGLLVVFGVDYWPWYYILRLVGYAALCVYVWWVLRRRGADPIVAFGTYAVLLFLGASGWQNLATANNLVALAVLTTVALLFAETAAPPPAKRRWLVFGLLVLALATSSLAIAIMLGITAALLLTRRFLAWWPSLVGAAAVYGVWWAAFGRGHRTSPDPTVAAVLAIPRGIFNVLRYAIPSVLSVPDALGMVLTLALVAAGVWLLVKGRLGVFEWCFLFTFAAFFALVVVARIHPGQAFPNAERYTYNAAFLLIPVFGHREPRGGGGDRIPDRRRGAGGAASRRRSPPLRRADDGAHRGVTGQRLVSPAAG